MVELGGGYRAKEAGKVDCGDLSAATRCLDGVDMRDRVV
jgi:hypothetical protein